jgi:hypothetical protein
LPCTLSCCVGVSVFLFSSFSNLLPFAICLSQCMYLYDHVLYFKW